MSHQYSWHDFYKHEKSEIWAWQFVSGEVFLALVENPREAGENAVFITLSNQQVEALKKALINPGTCLSKAVGL